MKENLFFFDDFHKSVISFTWKTEQLVKVVEEQLFLSRRIQLFKRRNENCFFLTMGVTSTWRLISNSKVVITIAWSELLLLIGSTRFVCLMILISIEWNVKWSVVCLEESNESNVRSYLSTATTSIEFFSWSKRNINWCIYVF